MQSVFAAVEALLGYAVDRGLCDREDIPYCRNGIYAALQMEPPAAEDPFALIQPMPESAAAALDKLALALSENDVLPGGELPEHMQARLMGILTARPSEIAARFNAIEREKGALAATDWFYALCRANNYIRVREIGRNIAFDHPSRIGDLTITINLSRPERDPRDIAAERALPPAGYPRCMLCVENPGYDGRANYPARHNHRMIPLTLEGQRWYLQYSPYLYYDEHCILLNERHTPMRMDGSTFARMFAFVERFAHYFIGSNAGLPIVGGSILSHDHFQGGRHTFPMMRAKTAVALTPPAGIESAAIVDWPLSALRLRGRQVRPLREMAERVLDAWQRYSDPEFGILCHTDAPHNAITPIVSQSGGLFTLDLVLRNNRTDDARPQGIFHTQSRHTHIKKENIGLIEVMGLFILPGRLQSELQGVQDALVAPTPPVSPAQSGDWAADGPLAKHYPWLMELRERYGSIPSESAGAILRRELTNKCADVLTDCGIYPQATKGYEGFLRFLGRIGLERLE